MVIIIVIVTLGVIYYSGIIDIPKIGTEITGKAISKNVNKISCPENLVPRLIVLNKFDLFFYDDHYGDEYTRYTSGDGKWLDGEKLSLTDNRYNSLCEEGSKEGQNVNYYYCYNIEYNKQNTPISEEGVIGKTEVKKFYVDLVLEKVMEENMPFIKVNGFNAGDDNPIRTFRLVSYECKRNRT